MGHYIPLTWMTFGLDYLLWGMQPRGYHLTNLVLHAANGVVFYFVGRRILGLALPRSGNPDYPRLALSAAFAALLFSLHPLRVESVAWATERRDVLSGFFYLGTLLAYLRACERQERRRWWYAGSVALFICALLSKSMAVSLPVVLLILDVYPLGRLGGGRRWWGQAARRVYLEKIPFFLFAGAGSVLAFPALARLSNMASLDQVSVPGRLAVSAYGLSFYLWKTVAPVNLSPLYELRTVSPWATPFLLSYAGVVALSALAWTLRRRVPGLLATWLTYVVILLPVLGFFQNGPQLAADRYTYLACLGWAVLAGAGVLSSWRPLPFLPPGLPAGVLVALGVLTWTQAQVWHNSAKLWAHAAALDPHSSIAQNNLGNALADQGNPAKAIDHYQQALRLRPHFSEALYNLGLTLAEQGKLAEAIQHFERALKIKPNYAEAHYSWGAVLAHLGRPAEAIEQYRQALRIRPDYADAHNNWGVALAKKGKPTEAIEHYRQALQIKPDFAEAHHNWGTALAQQGKPAEAIEQYRRALTIRPDFAAAHYSWGQTLAQQGKRVEAMEHFQRARSITPNTTNNP
jgi:Tfp pilus assembly protein PilF